MYSEMQKISLKSNIKLVTITQRDANKSLQGVHTEVSITVYHASCVKHRSQGFHLSTPVCIYFEQKLL
jgi:hypothetical protein